MSGSRPWNTGLHGIHCSPASEFKKGHRGARTGAIGAVRIRTDHGQVRAFVKIAEPNVWRLRSVLTWEAAHGPLAAGLVVHHRDGNSLNDALENLQALTRAEHIRVHHAELVGAKASSFVARKRVEQTREQIALPLGVGT